MSADKHDQDEDGGSSVGDVAKVADTKLMTSLFGPSAAVVGKYLEGRTKGLINWLEGESQRSQQRNLEGHVSNVVNVTGQSLGVQAAQIVKLERWIRIAAEIPVEDLERSAVVEAALEELASTMGSPAFEEAAEKLTSGSARLLLEAPSDLSINPKGIDRNGFEQLRSLGLANTANRPNVVAQIAAWLIGTVVGLVLLFGAIRLATAWYPLLFLGFLATEFIINSVVISAVAVSLGILAVSARYRLTDYGKSLQKAARRFYRGEDRPRKADFLASIFRRPSLIWGGFAALTVCSLPFALQAYLPSQLRFNALPPTIIISSAPTNPSGPTPSPPATTSPPGQTPQQITLTAENIRTLIDVWRSVAGQMNEIINLTNAGQAQIPNWPQTVKSGPQNFGQELIRLRNSINQRRISLQSLYNAYQGLPNVRSTLAQVATTGVFDRLYAALDSFSHETQNLPAPPAPLPEDFENTLRPYAGELKGALDAMARWANDTRNFAARQSEELSKANIK